MKFSYAIRLLFVLIWTFSFIFTSPALICADSITLDTIVVTAAAENEADEKNIKAKTLRTHKVVDLAEILSNEMTEATMIRKGGYGNEVSLRGFGKSDLRVLVDGGVLEGACGSRKDPSLSHINMLTVDKIEVRQGPFDVTKAGALGGSINVMTRKPQKEFLGEILIKAGTYDFLSSVFHTTGGTEKVQGLIGYNYSESDQYEDGDGNRLYKSAPAGRPYNAEGENMKAFEKHDVWGKLQFTPTENQTILFSYAYGEADDIMTPRAGVDIDSEKTYMSRVRYSITGLGNFSDELNFSLYQNRIEHEPSDKYRELVGAPSFHRHNEVKSTITGGKIENKKSAGSARFTYGADAYKHNWKGDMYRDDTGVNMDDELIPDVNSYDFGLYLNAYKNYNKLSLNAGFRYDRFESEADEALKQSIAVTSTNKNNDDLFSGYLSAEYYLTDNSFLFGGIGQSIRTPTAVERYLQSPSPYFHGNPDLDSTKNREFDLGFRLTGQRFSFSAKGFYSDLKDYIYQQGKQTADSHQTWTNIDAHICGADVKMIADIISDFSVETAAAWQRGKKDSEPEYNNDDDLAEVPPLKTKLALHYDTQMLFGTLEWIHSANADNIDTDAGEKALSGWDVVNFRGGWNYKMLTLNVGVENIFDRRYAVANSYEWDVVSGSGANPAIVYEPGRFFYASVSCKF
ncbi:TonB-dependent receptor [Desulfonema magnum]|uniref:TonB-dependent receptor n=1 Tax=Desulfonema magnum TaxID=45655 RepID=A0A975GTV8_9BACT|nr:TonB-dependent receptor [Desulfonema magnum]QTA92533.1 TonB-dependent receptor [Desulfonema magnum]